MKWYQVILIVIYAIPAAYLLYTGALHTFVYFANKNLGHQESFFMAGRNLGFGLFLLVFSMLAWYLFKQPSPSKIHSILAYLPFSIVLLYVLWMAIVLISLGGKWN